MKSKRLPHDLVVMYHSIESEKFPAVLGSYPISLRRFQYQVEQLHRLGYEIADLDTSYGLNDGVKRAFLTSDDGTVDWLHNVLSWCESEQLPTHTALLSGPWHETPVYPLAHRIQLALSLRQKGELYELFQVIEQQITQNQRDYIHYAYQHESCKIRRMIKGALNLVWDEQQATEILGEPSVKERYHLQERFAHFHEYKDLKFASFGTHTHSHRSFSGSAQAYFEEEILYAEIFLRDKGLKLSRYFTLPLKPKINQSMDVLIGILSRHGFKGMLTSDCVSCTNLDSFIVPRIDAAHLEKWLGVAEYSVFKDTGKIIRAL